MTTIGWVFLFVFARIIDLVIWYFLNRGSVRANDQIAILKEISEKQSAQIDLLISMVHKKEEPEKDYLEEARKKAGLL
ncbi:TPA: YebO family protein [Raoultella ornithinolytica]